MKNLKVSVKLIVSFLIVAVMTAVVGGVGIYGMNDINNMLSEMYDKQTVPMPYMTKIAEMLQRQRACVRDMVIGAAIDDMALVEDAKRRADEYHVTLVENLAPYRATIVNPDALPIFDEARALYETDFRDCKNEIYDLARRGEDATEIYAALTKYTRSVNLIVEDFEKVGYEGRRRRRRRQGGRRPVPFPAHSHHCRAARGHLCGAFPCLLCLRDYQQALGHPDRIYEKGRHYRRHTAQPRGSAEH